MYFSSQVTLTGKPLVLHKPGSPVVRSVPSPYNAVRSLHQVCTIFISWERRGLSLTGEEPWGPTIIVGPSVPLSPPKKHHLEVIGEIQSSGQFVVSVTFLHPPASSNRAIKMEKTKTNKKKVVANLTGSQNSTVTGRGEVAHTFKSCLILGSFICTS